MTKDQLNTHITRFIHAENIVQELKNKYGVNIIDSKFSNFYNEYNYLIHNLLISIFGEEKTNLIEDFCFQQTELSFDELWKEINK